MKEQTILDIKDDYTAIDEYIINGQHESIMLVAGNSLEKLPIFEYFRSLENRLCIQLVCFSEFKPNPSYESVVEGVRILRERACSLIIAVGGGSAIDVAKCIKLFANMDETQNYLKQEIIPNTIDLLALPTTAGTGSEATRYAVIYYNGEKQSVTHESCIPSAIIWYPKALSSLPLYQRKVTMLDAFCHAMESCWSVNSTDESIGFAADAIRIIVQNYKGYIRNDEKSNEKMLKASFLAGKAINITATTAGHAMSYKLTSLYGISHGHAVALCVYELFPYMYRHLNDCIDPRGSDILISAFQRIVESLGCQTIEEGIHKLRNIVDEMELAVPQGRKEELPVLVSSVNAVRLKNNPVRLDETALTNLYKKIIKLYEDE